jgi:hypothetical protein
MSVTESVAECRRCLESKPGCNRRVWATHRNADSGAGAAVGEGIPSQPRRWTQAPIATVAFRSNRLRAAHRVPVEVIAEEALRQCQFDSRPLYRMRASGVLRPARGKMLGRVRRDGGHRLAMAKRRRRVIEGLSGARIRGAEPDGSVEEMGASVTWWSTGVAARCRPT